MSTGTASADRDLLVLFAANNYGGVMFADQQLAVALARRVPVLYVDPPLSHVGARRADHLGESLRRPRLRAVAPGLHRLTPLAQPGVERPGLTGLTAALTRRQVTAAARRLGARIDAVIATWPLIPVLGRYGEQVGVYWAQDDLAGGAALLGLDPERVLAGERDMARRADAIVAANPLVADTLGAAGHDPELIPYGCDAAAFAVTGTVPPADDVPLPRPIAGFVGHLGDRIDLAVLTAVADTGCSVLLVGPVHPRFEPQACAELLARPNVAWVGPRPFAELPAYLSWIDVGLVPYADSAFNRGSFPLKTLEYLAAGVPVVSTDLPASRWLGPDHVTIADGPTAFADAVVAGLGAVRSEAAVDARRAFAREHSWDRRAEAFLDVIARARGGSQRRAGAAAGRSASPVPSSATR